MKYCLLIMFFVSFGVFADSEQEAKYAAIDRYQKSQNPTGMIEKYVEAYSKTLKPKQAALFKDVMLNELDLEYITNSIKPIMAKHFSLPEIEALADFYESPHGSSAMSKMGPYMAEFQPIYNAELKRVLAVWKEKAQSVN